MSAPISATPAAPAPITFQPPVLGDGRRRGIMLVLSSPSGAGKTTISRRLLAIDPSFVLSVSVTTRPPRPGEEHGVHYYFVSDAQFEDMAQSGQLLEHARVFDKCYGTPREPVERHLADGRDVMFDIDWQGHRQLHQTAPDDIVSIFILPPSYPELLRRLRDRQQDSEEVIRKRMAKAPGEISHWDEYDYVLVNHDLEATLANVQAILAVERLRRRRQLGLGDFVTELQAGQNLTEA